jgi:myo-inositol-1(or 4)-monophosphatase
VSRDAFDVVEVFREVARVIRDAVMALDVEERRLKTDRPGQYLLDVRADGAALDVLHRARLAVLSEESGRTGPAEADLAVVLDPVDGSTNCARGISYWGTSICAVDAQGPVAALVVNQATGSETWAVRGGGARRDGRLITPSPVEQVDASVVALAGVPARLLLWRQFRALGCVALALCDVAAGGIDGYVDGATYHAPWDYLGAYLVCREAGASIVDASGRALETTDLDARRQLIAAGTPALLESLRPAAGVVR